MPDPASRLALLTISIETRLDHGFNRMGAVRELVRRLETDYCNGNECQELSEYAAGLLARVIVGIDESKCAWYGTLIPELRSIVTDLRPSE